VDETVTALAALEKLSEETAATVASAHTVFMALPAKERKAEKAHGEWLSGLAEESAKLDLASQSLHASVKEFAVAAEQAATEEELAALKPKLAELQAASDAYSPQALEFLKKWHLKGYEAKLVALEGRVALVPAKRGEWKKAKQDAELKSLVDLQGRATTEIKGYKELLAGLDKMTTDNARETLVAVSDSLLKMSDLDKEIQLALGREVKAAEVVAEVKTEEIKKEEVKTEEVKKEEVKKEEVKKETTEEKASAATLKKLTKQVKKERKSLRSLRDKLKDRSRAWSKAGNEKKVKEVDEARATVEALRNGLMDTETLLHKKQLDAASMAFSAIAGALPPAKKTAQALLKEKVKSVGGLDKAAEEELQAFLKTLKCPGGMQRVITKNPKRKGDLTAAPFVAFCIDRYEYPGKGRMPKTKVSWDAANGACTAKGGRLCRNWEWKKACGGKYPYGGKYDSEGCNTVDEDGIERDVLPAGSKKKCKARGLYDMVGNVAEWTHEKTVNGGDSYKTAEEATCYRSVKRFGGSSYVGFRCCADPK
jgi:hypothetical protein